MKIAIIPARGGSKRIPHKNIKDFCGKPMIVWSIEAAIQSQCFDQIIVSTDDERIADIANKAGASVPFIRPADLADDYTGTTAVITHAIKQLKLNHMDLVCCLYATAPFVKAEDIQRGEAILAKEACNYAFTVTSYSFPIQRAIKLNKNNRVEMFQPKLFDARSQDLEEAWHDAGQFYWGKASAWLENKPIFSTNSAPIKLPRYRVQDIDTLEDWQQAELMFEAIKAKQNSKTRAL